MLIEVEAVKFIQNVQNTKSSYEKILERDFLLAAHLMKESKIVNLENRSIFRPYKSRLHSWLRISSVSNLVTEFIELLWKKNSNSRLKKIVESKIYFYNQKREIAIKAFGDISTNKSALMIKELNGKPYQRIPAMFAVLKSRWFDSPTIESLIAIYKNTKIDGFIDEYEYSLVCYSLASAGGEIVIPSLVSMLINNDKKKFLNENVIGKILEAISEVSESSAVPFLVKTLNAKDASIRSAVVAALCNIGDRQALDALIYTLHSDSESKVRLGACNAISYIGTSEEQVIEALIIALQGDTEASVRRSACHALCMIDPFGAENLMIDALKDNDLEIQMIASEYLGKIDSKKATNLLHNILINLIDGGRQAFLVRKAVLDALGRIGDPISVPIIIESLKMRPGFGDITEAEFEELSIAYIQTLGNLRDTRAVEAVFLYLTFFSRGDLQDSIEFRDFLNQFNPEDLIPILVNLLEFDNENSSSSKYDLSERIFKAFIILGPISLSALAQILNNTKNEHVAFRIVEILGDIGDKGSIPILVEQIEIYISDDKKNYRLDSAMNSLNKLEKSQDIPDLYSLLQRIGFSPYTDILVKVGGKNKFSEFYKLAQQEKDPGQRLIYISALGVLGNQQALPLLLDIYRNGSLLERDETMLALARLGNKEGLDDLLSWLSDKNKDKSLISYRALSLFSETKNVMALPVLIKLLAHPDLEYSQSNPKIITTIEEILDAQKFPSQVNIDFELLIGSEISRIHVIKILKKLKRPDAFEYLLQYRVDDYWREEGLEAIIELCEDKNLLTQKNVHIIVRKLWGKKENQFYLDKLFLSISDLDLGLMLVSELKYYLNCKQRDLVRLSARLILLILRNIGISHDEKERQDQLQIIKHALKIYAKGNYGSALFSESLVLQESLVAESVGHLYPVDKSKFIKNVENFLWFLLLASLPIITISITILQDSLKNKPTFLAVLPTYIQIVLIIILPALIGLIALKNEPILKKIKEWFKFD